MKEKVREGRERTQTRELEEKCKLEGRREHDKRALALYLSMHTLWFSVYIRFRDGFTELGICRLITALCCLSTCSLILSQCTESCAACEYYVYLYPCEHKHLYVWDFLCVFVCLCLIDSLN